MKAVALATLLSAVALAESPDGGIVDVETARILTPSGQLLDVDGGAWLSTDTLLRVARDRERLRAENEELKRVPPPPSVPWVVVAFVAGVALGGVVGAVLVR